MTLDTGWASLKPVRVNPVLGQIGSNAMSAIQDRARNLRDAGRPLVDFSIGDPREPTAPFIPEALKAAVPAVSQYPTVLGLPGLRQAIAAYIERRFGVTVDPDSEVLPTTGSKESIFSTPLAFIDRAAGDGVVWATPGYTIYERGGRLAGAVPFPITLSGDFVFRAADIPPEIWKRARMVWLCNPHNPSGSVTPLDELSAFRDHAARHGVLLCSDECYVDLYDDEPPPSVLETGGTEGVIVYLSLSKRSGMTGYRSGAMVGDSRAISALKSLRTGTGTAPPEFTQAAAIAAWNDDRHVAERREVFKRKRDILTAGFADLGFRAVASRAGLYIWLKVNDDLDIAARLLEHGVVVSPGRVFGEGGEGYIRLAMVPTVDECEEAVEVVRNCLNSN